jgi:hypothetical protein
MRSSWVCQGRAGSAGSPARRARRASQSPYSQLTRERRFQGLGERQLQVQDPFRGVDPPVVQVGVVFGGGHAPDGVGDVVGAPGADAVAVRQVEAGAGLAGARGAADEQQVPGPWGDVHGS